jgi:uncharacterized membrane protein
MDREGRGRNRPEGDRGGERGQVAPLVVIVLLAALGAVVLLVQVGRVTVARSEAQTAADAAALAGALEGRDGADELARANGAVLVSFATDGAEVQVVVEHGDVRATARARRDVGG